MFSKYRILKKRQAVRSALAQELHAFIIGACKAEDQQELDCYLNKINNIIREQENQSFLFELSINKFSHFDDVLHIPYKEHIDQKWASHVANQLATTLVGLASQEVLTFWLRNMNSFGFAVLNTALASKDPALVEFVLTLLRLETNTTELILNLVNSTNDGFMPIFQAFADKELLDPLLFYFEKRKNLLKINLESMTKFGHTVLHQAIFTNDIEMVNKLYALVFICFNKNVEKTDALFAQMVNQGAPFDPLILENNSEIAHFLSRYGVRTLMHEEDSDSEQEISTEQDAPNGVVLHCFARSQHNNATKHTSFYRTPRPR